MVKELDYLDPIISTGVINKLPLMSSFFTQMFVRERPSNAEHFKLEVVTKGVSMLPAIDNYSPGTMRQGNKREVGYVTAPRFRPKRGFSKPDVFKIPPGSNPFDPMDNPVERALAEDMAMHRSEIDYTLEVMCAQAVVHGKLNLYDFVDGRRVPTYTVDFLRPAAHNVILTGSALWSNSGSNLLAQMDEWDTMIQEETNIASSDLYLGSKAWEAFRKHPDVKDQIDTTSGVDAGSLTLRVARKFKGTWNGLNVWVVSGTYADMDGTVKNFLDPEYALLVASGAQNVIEFGIPMDLECPAPVEVFSKIFVQKDPSGIFSLCETRPLPQIKQPGWVVYARVL